MVINSGTQSTQELHKILSAFKISDNVYTFKAITDGFINDTFLVCANELPVYILQRINHKIFVNVEGLMSNIDKVLKQAKAKDYAQIKLVTTHGGKTYASLSNGYWRVMTYITNSTAYNTTTEPEIAFEAGRITGRFHSLLANTSTHHFIDTIPKFHDIDLRKMQFLAALSRASKNKIDIATTAISFAQQTLAKLEAIENKQLPLRICHNDTKLNNILFSKKTNKALCLIDLDTIMKGYFHYDFGDAIRTIVNTAAEDEKEHSKITFEKKLFEAFVRGLAHNDLFLTKEEVEALPFGVVLMPFLHGIRALSDYLNGNIYYKVAYENQNLDRCLSLFDFTQKAIDQFEYMERVVLQQLLNK